nr:D-alanyl-D-alanine carboxypeptidase [Clostridia bacterium]
MKRIICTLLAVCIALGGATWPADALSKAPTIEAESYILVDMTTGESLLEAGADDRHYPASTTKIMTCLLALENLNLESDITADAEAAATGGSALGLQEGEVMNALVMLHAMMIPSSNDCAVAIAKQVAGSVDNFAVMMNARAREIGCKYTNFVNPNGLHEDNHYTTARDLSLIALEAMKNPTFREIVGTWEYTIPATSRRDETVVTNTNLLLGDESDKYRIYVGNDLRYCKYDYATGIKTGSTPEAGGCLVASAEKDGTKLLCVLLAGTSLGRFADAIKLFEWGFDNYKTHTVLHGGYSFGDVKVHHGEFNKVEAVLLTDVAYTLTTDASIEIMSAQAVLEEELEAPVKKGDLVGRITLYEGDEPVGTYDAVAMQSIKEGGILSYFYIEDATAKVIEMACAIGLGVIFLGLVAYVIVM